MKVTSLRKRYNVNNSAALLEISPTNETFFWGRLSSFWFV